MPVLCNGRVYARNSAGDLVCVAAPASTVFIPSIVGVKFVFYREGDDLTSFLSSTGLLQIAWGLG